MADICSLLDPFGISTSTDCVSAFHRWHNQADLVFICDRHSVIPMVPLLGLKCVGRHLSRPALGPIT